MTKQEAIEILRKESACRGEDKSVCNEGRDCRKGCPYYYPRWSGVDDTTDTLQMAIDIVLEAYE